jgi:hypothetical protein
MYKSNSSRPPISARIAPPDTICGLGAFFAQIRPHIGPPAPIAVAGAPIRPPSTAIYSGRWGRCGSKTGLALAAFPFPCLPRRRNSSPPTIIIRLATHRSEPHVLVACRGAPQSAAAGVTPAVEAHHVATATMTTLRRRSAAPTSRASAGRGGSRTTPSCAPSSTSHSVRPPSCPGLAPPHTRPNLVASRCDWWKKVCTAA